MSERSWKYAERRIAALLGGRRVPVSGRQRGSAPDIEHPTLSIEVKSRREVPAWLTEALEQAESSRIAEGSGKLPVAVVHKQGRPYADALVVVRLSEFARDPFATMNSAGSAWPESRTEGG